jgi:glycosyltransferase involved in cell wall biosynthesis
VSGSRVLIIIPAFNERENLPSVARDLREHLPAADVVVVNDGSTDGTDAVARFLGLPVISLPYNLGIGAAVQTGLLFAAEEGYDYAVQFDGDGQHCADQISEMLELLRQEQADVVIGSRFLGESTYRPPLLRKIGIRIIRVLNSLVLRQPITDSTSGFRAYNRPAVRFLAHEYPHDYPEPEAIVSLAKQGFRIAEVGVMMRKRLDGRSSITLFKSIYYMCKVLIAIAIGATRQPKVRRILHEPANSDYRDRR